MRDVLTVCIVCACQDYGMQHGGAQWHAVVETRWVASVFVHSQLDLCVVESHR